MAAVIIANFFMACVLCCNSNDLLFFVTIQNCLESKAKTIACTCEKQACFNRNNPKYFVQLQLVMVNHLSSAEMSILVKKPSHIDVIGRKK